MVRNRLRIYCQCFHENFYMVILPGWAGFSYILIIYALYCLIISSFYSCHPLSPRLAGRQSKCLKLMIMDHSALVLKSVLGPIETQIYKLSEDPLPFSYPCSVWSLSQSMHSPFISFRASNMKYAFAFLALTAVASGHSIFQQIVAGGTEYGESTISPGHLKLFETHIWQGLALEFASQVITGYAVFLTSAIGFTKPLCKPITDVSSNDIACNGGPNPTTPSNQIINVVAGETVKAKWRHSDASKWIQVTLP